MDSDGNIARNNILKLIGFIESDKKEDINNLFSVNKKKEIDNLDTEIDDLCEYYKGKYELISANGLESYDPINNGKITKYFKMFYNIFTTEEKYHFSILWYIKDDYDSNNIGIWSIFVERYDNNDIQAPIDSWNLGITLL